MSNLILRAPAPARPGLVRTALWLGLCLGEMITISWLYEVPANYAPADNPFTPVRHLVVWALVALAAFGLLMSPRPAALTEAWRSEQERHDSLSALLLNLSLFLPLAIASAFVTATLAARPYDSHVTLLSAYGLLLAATAVSLLRIDISIASALRLANTFRNELVIAAAASAFVMGLSVLATYGWKPMAMATLTLVKAMLDLYEPMVIIDGVERILRVGDFAVRISPECAGYEGIALVSAFLSIYLWLFRDQFLFPRAFILYLIGIPGIWLLNCVRIAALASLGAHVDPRIAAQGFHSQAGWIAFLVATLAMMALARRWTFLHRRAAAAPTVMVADVRPDEDRALHAHLVPFMALMAASIAIAASAPFDRHLYGLKLLAVAAAIWAFRDVYRDLRWRVPAEAILAGLVVGAVWIATDPAAGEGTLGPWLEAMPAGLALAWLVVRVLGTVVAVPIAEELAFRGFLARWVVRRDFTRVPYGRFSLAGILVSSALFGLMHERWLAGMLAGAVFALVMYRSRSISGAIAAHMAANALIAVWAILFRQWSLL